MKDRIFEGVFDDEYTASEIEWYGVKEAECGEVAVDYVKLEGRCDNYLHKAFYLGQLSVPRMKIAGKTWMSLTPMEIQSAAYALHRAGGHIATAGLGMGYFALRAAAKDSVGQVDVYESNPDVVEFFMESFADRDELKKIYIIEGDVREEMRGITYDMVFMDIYKDMLPDETLEDIRAFPRNNNIDEYLFWGFEFVMWAAFEYEIFVDDLMTPALAEYFREFGRNTARVNLSKIGFSLPDEEFVAKVMELMPYPI